MRIDHAGYAVSSIKQYLADFFVPLFQPESVTEIMEDPLQGVRVAFATMPGGARVELIEPMTPDSPVNKILDARRGGLYHLCYEVEHLEEQIESFQKKGCLLISGPTPAVAFQQRRIVFLFTPQRDVIELVERERAGTRHA